MQGMEGSPGPGYGGKAWQAGAAGELLGAHTDRPQRLQILQVVGLQQPLSLVMYKATITHI